MFVGALSLPDTEGLPHLIRTAVIPNSLLFNRISAISLLLKRLRPERPISPKIHISKDSSLERLIPEKTHLTKDSSKRTISQKTHLSTDTSLGKLIPRKTHLSKDSSKRIISRKMISYLIFRAMSSKTHLSKDPSLQ